MGDSRSRKKWSDAAYVLKAESIGLANRSDTDVKYTKKEKIKLIPGILTKASRKTELKTVREQTWGKLSVLDMVGLRWPLDI
jgi:hypothetical protein